MPWRTRLPHSGLSCINCFLSLYDARFERKSLWKSFASYAPHGYFSGYPGRMNLVHIKKVYAIFSKGMSWRTRPPHHRCYSCYCHLREWVTDTSQYKKLITVIIHFSVVEMFSDHTRPKICYTNIIPVRRFKVQMFSNGYTDPKFIPYEIFSHEN